MPINLFCLNICLKILQCLCGSTFAGADSGALSFLFRRAKVKTKILSANAGRVRTKRFSFRMAKNANRTNFGKSREIVVV
jgi:hypothetical protein